MGYRQCTLTVYTHLYIFYQYLMITYLLSPACFLSKPYLSALIYMFSINILPAYTHLYVLLFHFWVPELLLLFLYLLFLI